MSLCDLLELYYCPYSTQFCKFRWLLNHHLEQASVYSFQIMACGLCNYGGLFNYIFSNWSDLLVSALLLNRFISLMRFTGKTVAAGVWSGVVCQYSIYGRASLLYFSKWSWYRGSRPYSPLRLLSEIGGPSSYDFLLTGTFLRYIVVLCITW